VVTDPAATLDVVADLLDRLERVVRRHILDAVPVVARQEMEPKTLSSLFIEYRIWRGRFVAPGPRQVHRAPELVRHPKASTHRAALDAIEHATRNGDDLTPHLSRAVRRLGRDLLLADWGIHHLHLSTSLDPDGFVSRTGDVLFAAFTATDAYWLDIRKHEKDGDNWAAEEVFAILVRNWPGSGLVHRFEGDTGLSQKYSDEDRRELRKAGVMNLMEVDSKVYVPGGVGLTTAGTPIEATRAANAFMWELQGWRDADPYERLRQVDGASRSAYWTPAVHVVMPGFEEWAGFMSGSTFVPIGQDGRII
jgi:hypothetical protein